MSHQQQERTWAVMIGDAVYEWCADEAEARAKVAELNEFSARPNDRGRARPVREAAMRLNRQSRATILAALRSYQETLALNGDEPPTHLYDLATNGGECEPMGADNIDLLCEEINT